jgi:hypothetical protein
MPDFCRRRMAGLFRSSLIRSWRRLQLVVFMRGPTMHPTREEPGGISLLLTMRAPVTILSGDGMEAGTGEP